MPQDDDGSEVPQAVSHVAMKEPACASCSTQLAIAIQPAGLGGQVRWGRAPSWTGETQSTYIHVQFAPARMSCSPQL